MSRAGALTIISALPGMSRGIAQQPVAPRRIGVLQTGSWPKQWVRAFRQGLLDAGYSEGRDVVIEWRYDNGDYNRIPQLVADLIKHKVELIVVDSTPATSAAKRATSTIPIVSGDLKLQRIGRFETA